MAVGEDPFKTRVGHNRIPGLIASPPAQRKSGRLQNPLSASLKALRTGRVMRRTVSPLGEYSIQFAIALNQDVGRKVGCAGQAVNLKLI